MSSERLRLASSKNGSATASRLLPLSIAGVVCFIVATILGYGGWYLFGSRDGAAREDVATVVKQTAPAPPPTPAPTPQPVKLAPAGEMPVTSGEVSIGGEGTDLPLRRELVEPFFVAETEVTNGQYLEFVKAAGRKAPAGWKDGAFPPGTALEPVVGVSWEDAVEYCRWLSQEIGAQVRLPTEAEWKLAASGTEAYKYPWGNDWDANAADSSETGGRIRAVKSFPAGRSPAGAFDMAGNVWEWTADAALDAEGQPKERDSVTLRIIKGGSAKEPRAFSTTAARYEVAADKSSPTLGFRYVVEREKTEERPPPANSPSN